MTADLRLIATFVEAARRLSFSGAAKALGTTPGSVSQNIRNLEDQLGARLFTRTTRQVNLTTEGTRYLARCAPALDALSEAESVVRDEHTALAGRLRVSSTTAFGRTHLLPVIANFMHDHPDIEVDLSLSDGFVDLVADGFDCAVRGGILPVNDYISRRILPVTPLVCASPDYAVRRDLPSSVDALSGHLTIGMRSNPSQRVFAWEFAAAEGGVRQVEIDPVLVVNDPEGAVQAAIQGIGLAQVGSNVVLPHVAAGRLVLSLTETAVASRGLYLVYPSRRFVPRRLEMFMQTVTDHFAGRSDLTWPPTD